MFDPSKIEEQKNKKKIKKNAIKEIKKWISEIIPMDQQTNLLINVEEIQCGDPNCAPIDTIISLIWENGGQGIFGIPCEVHELDREGLLEFFPDTETIQLWSEGKEAEWPKQPPLRFEVGTRVDCRIGPHPVRDWVPGSIIMLNYRESNWPPGMCAPYQVQLDDGRLIFAPRDINEVIRLSEVTP